MSIKLFLRGAALGALFASVTTLLLAPKTGKKTRADATRLAHALSERLSTELDRAGVLSRERYEEIVNNTVAEYARGTTLAKGFAKDLSAVLNTYFSEVKKEFSKPLKKPSPAKKKRSKTA
ncbi:YtxH domain-containing protein [Candidatus Uhrbacteria bacterium]|nr:YtxH domain-containing protein [Candidatus Uhrbacteria bacterium]